jgi:hypothetical protein
VNDWGALASREKQGYSSCDFQSSRSKRICIADQRDRLDVGGFLQRNCMVIGYPTLLFQAMGQTLNTGQEMPISGWGNGEYASKNT